jgi:hypothetical protein
METATDSSAWVELVAWTRQHRIWSRLSPIVPALLFALTWFAFSGPVIYWDLLAPAVFGWMFFTLAWLLLLAIQLIRRFFGSASFSWRPWLYFPAFMAVTAVACWIRAPLWLGHLTSRPAMDNVAHDVMAGKRDPSKIHWIGVYPVSSAWRSDHGFVFYVNGTGQDGWNDHFLEWGFLYSATNPRNPKATDYGYCEDVPLHHLTGRWYKLQSIECGA